MEIVGSRLMFFGHEVFPCGILPNIALAIVPLFLLDFVIRLQNKNKAAACLIGYIWLMFMPNSMYLLMEFRHIIVRDGVADAGQLEAVIVFFLLAMLGVGLSMFQIYKAATGIHIFKDWKILSVVVLSILISWGSMLGVIGMQSVYGMLAPWLIAAYSVWLANINSVGMAAIMAGLLALLSLCCIVLFTQKESEP